MTWTRPHIRRAHALAPTISEGRRCCVTTYWCPHKQFDFWGRKMAAIILSHRRVGVPVCGPQERISLRLNVSWWLIIGQRRTITKPTEGSFANYLKGDQKAFPCFWFTHWLKWCNWRRHQLQVGGQFSGKVNCHQSIHGSSSWSIDFVLKMSNSIQQPI